MKILKLLSTTILLVLVSSASTASAECPCYYGAPSQDENGVSVAKLGLKYGFRCGATKVMYCVDENSSVMQCYFDKNLTRASSRTLFVVNGEARNEGVDGDGNKFSQVCKNY